MNQWRVSLSHFNHHCLQSLVVNLRNCERLLIERFYIKTKWYLPLYIWASLSYVLLHRLHSDYLLQHQIYYVLVEISWTFPPLLAYSNTNYLLHVEYYQERHLSILWTLFWSSQHDSVFSDTCCSIPCIIYKKLQMAILQCFS